MDASSAAELDDASGPSVRVAALGELGPGIGGHADDPSESLSKQPGKAAAAYPGVDGKMIEVSKVIWT